LKHAGASALDSLQELIANLRQLPGLVERKPGIFYVNSKAYLHFHEDPVGLFADVRLEGGEFERFRVSTKQEQAALVKAVAANRSA
jgi:hypothetical protein